ncbi:GmrSD restriction endonuclease domain-containing protein [Terrabacter aeriphilus]|uniref:GmrSD restriction endonuclease domain-containing protein n=1 Tax=Terrabacter aeriphilus TaxID=515662 RepID=UPI0031EEE993
MVPSQTVTGDVSTSPVPPPRAGSALALLARLRTAEPGPATGFSRARFGKVDLDVDGNGCDTRNDVLRRDMTKLVLAAKSNGCAVLRGSLRDPYTGRTISYVRGPQTSKAVLVDYTVPLSEVWRSGAAGWSDTKRAAFANDSLAVLAVDAAAARKRASEPLTWQPPTTALRCALAARQITVKAKYGLSVDARERATLELVLRPCRDELATKSVAFRLGGGREEKTAQQIANEKAKAAAQAKAAANARAKAEARARAKAARVAARAAAAAQAKAKAAAAAQAKAAARAKARAAAKAKAKAAAQAKAAAAAKATTTATRSN